MIIERINLINILLGSNIIVAQLFFIWNSISYLGTIMIKFAQFALIEFEVTIQEGFTKRKDPYQTDKYSEVFYGLQINTNYIYNNFWFMSTRKSTALHNYEIIRTYGVPCSLGFGSYGSVQLGKCLTTGNTVAIKKINRKIAQEQVRIHMQLDHPNIIKMIDFCFDELHKTTYIVLEYAQNGNLLDYMNENRQQDKKTIKNIFLSVCSAVSYLHSHKIMHRDLKPENILLTKNNTVKICDFGVAAIIDKDPRMTLCGTVEYMAPQMILKQPYNHKVDIWSLGILYFELIQGHAPFQGREELQVLEKMKKLIYFSEKFTEEEIMMIHQMLKVDPQERPQATEIIKNNGVRQSIGSSVGTRSTVESSKSEGCQNKIKIREIKNLYQPQKPAKMQIKSIRNLNNSISYSEKQTLQVKQKISLKRKF